MKRVILMHGKTTTPADKWYPWFGDRLVELGAEYCAPMLPKKDNPVLSEWTAELDACQPDQDTILVGHSRGGIAILRFLEQAESDLQVAAVILLGTNRSNKENDKMAVETSNGFYTERDYNFTKILSHCDHFFVLHSEDDPVVPYEAGVHTAVGLRVNLMTFEDRGHFSKDTKEVPELLEIVTSLI